MNKKLPIVLALGILGTLIVVGVTRFLPLRHEKITRTTSLPTQNSQIQEITNLEELSKALDGKRPMTLKFYANWCGACSAVKSYYSDLAQDIPDVDFYAINIDNEELMQEIDKQEISKEGIVYLPTFIMTHPEKNILHQQHGAKKKDEFAADIKKALEL